MSGLPLDLPPVTWYAPKTNYTTGFRKDMLGTFRARIHLTSEKGR